MKQHNQIFLSEHHNPWFNLATEDWLFRDADLKAPTLFLWRNEPSVIIGRAQNPWVECHISKMEQDGVHLARRQSGGGTVYHDLGNTNFTFLAPKDNYDKLTNLHIIISAIKTFGIDAYASGRNDILVDVNGKARKISGSAFRESKDHAFHHGTLLINADLHRLADYLNPEPKKLIAKGVKSVRSRVANLSELNNAVTHDTLSNAIINAFCQHYQQKIIPTTLKIEDLNNMLSLKTRFEEYQSWQWRFGKTLVFEHQLEHRFEWGMVSVNLNIRHGKISECKIYSDSLYPDVINAIESSLVGCTYQPQSIRKCLEPVFSPENMTLDISQWLSKNVT